MSQSLPFFDLRTVVAITGVMSCLMSIVLYSIKRTYPPSIKGIGEWASFPLLGFIASALYGMQGSWHHLASMALPNLLLVFTLLILVRGTYKHFGRDVNRKLVLGIFLVSLAFNLATSGKEQYYVHRLAFVSGVSSLMFAAQINVLWQHRRGSFAAYLMLCAMVMLCAVTAGRVISAFIQPPPVGIYTYSPIQAIYLVSYSFGVLLICLAAIFLSFEQLRKDLEKLLKYDALTGALTRRAAYEYGDDLLASTNRRSTVFSVLMMDLDYFKRINDVHGHQVGDAVLAEFVQIVQQVTRRPSGLGRYGGEEFVLLLPETSLDEAMQVAERVRAQVHAREQFPKFTVSIGVATFSKLQADTLDAVIGRADAALYVAKKNGRDRVEVDPSIMPRQVKA